MHFRSIDLRAIYTITDSHRLHSLLYHLVSWDKRRHISSLVKAKYNPEDGYETLYEHVQEPIPIVVIDNPRELLLRLEELLKSITTKPISTEDIKNLSNLYQELQKCILSQSS